MKLTDLQTLATQHGCTVEVLHHIPGERYELVATADDGLRFAADLHELVASSELGLDNTTPAKVRAVLAADIRSNGTERCDDEHCEWCAIETDYDDDCDCDED